MTDLEIVEAVAAGKRPAGVSDADIRAIEGELRYIRLRRECMAEYRARSIEMWPELAGEV